MFSAKGQYSDLSNRRGINYTTHFTSVMSDDKFLLNSASKFLLDRDFVYVILC